MVDLFGVHALDEANIVGNFSGMRHEVADPGPAFAVLFVGFDGREKLSFVSSGGHRAKPLALHITGGDGLAVALFKFRFVVEKFKVGGPTVLEKEDDAFCFRCDLFDGGRKLALVFGLRFLTKKRSECGDTDPGGTFAKELTTVDEVLAFEKRVHLFFG